MLEERIEEAVRVIRSGGIVAFPTETSYGLAVDPFCVEALTRLYQLKKRAVEKAVPLLVEDLDQLALLVKVIPEMYRPLIQAFWPGPLTLIFEARVDLPRFLTTNGNKIGLRISSHPMAGRLVKAAAMPITCTSANTSGADAALTMRDVQEQLGNRVDLVLDEDKGVSGGWSTVVGIEGNQLKPVRAGVIPFEDIIRANQQII